MGFKTHLPLYYAQFLASPDYWILLIDWKPGLPDSTLPRSLDKAMSAVDPTVVAEMSW